MLRSGRRYAFALATMTLLAIAGCGHKAMPPPPWAPPTQALSCLYIVGGPVTVRGKVVHVRTQLTGKATCDRLRAQFHKGVAYLPFPGSHFAHLRMPPFATGIPKNVIVTSESLDGISFRAIQPNGKLDKQFDRSASFLAVVVNPSKR